jgi:hypothetical protein
VHTIAIVDRCQEESSVLAAKKWKKLAKITKLVQQGAKLHLRKVSNHTY